MKKAFLFFIGITFLLLSGNMVNAQEVLDGVYVKNHVKNRRPIPYQYLREADVMWSKTIWRKVDLREKLNQQLYYPTKPLETRMSLIDLLMFGITKEGINAYKMNGDDEFGSVVTMKEIEEKFGAKETVQMVEDVATGQMVEKKIPASYSTAEVKQYLLKEVWFFDKQRSVMEVRIVGMCPVREYFKDTDVDQEDPKYKMIFWIYYPEARKVLANHEVFNAFNDGERRTFDDIFLKRLFSSFIYQESNQYNNRAVDSYTIGIEALLEAERIKESIFNFEQDLWEY